MVIMKDDWGFFLCAQVRNSSVVVGGMHLWICVKDDAGFKDVEGEEIVYVKGIVKMSMMGKMWTIERKEWL